MAKLISNNFRKWNKVLWTQSYFNIYYYFWSQLIFTGARELSYLRQEGGYSSLQFTGFKPCVLLLSWHQTLDPWASVEAVARGLRWKQGWGQLLWDKWNLPRSEIEPMSSALAGRLLSIAPPSKSPDHFIFR